MPFTDRPRPADRADRDSRAAATLTATRDAIVAPDGSRLAPTEVAQLTTRYEADRWALLAEDRRGREHVLLDELGSAEVEEAREAIEAVIAGG